MGVVGVAFHSGLIGLEKRVLAGAVEKLGLN